MQLSVKDIADHANMIINGYAYTKSCRIMDIMENKF